MNDFAQRLWIQSKMFKLYLFIFIHCLCTFVICKKTCTRNISITPISSYIVGYGYSPHWDKKTCSLYFIDYLAYADKVFHRYDYAKKRLYSAGLQGASISPSFMLPMAGLKNQFAVGNIKRIMVVGWNGCSQNATLIRNMTSVEEDQTATDYLDMGSVDPKGRLVTGTYREDVCVASSEANGTLYSFKRNGDIEPLIENLNSIAGLAWNRKKKVFYFFDSCNYTIYEYKWCECSGSISNPRPVFYFPVNHSYVPLGMDISCSGNLFVGKYMTPEIIEINPRTGRVVNTIIMPVDTITGLAFGGPRMDILFVTTSELVYLNYFDVEGPLFIASNNSMAGQTFMIKGLCTKGFPGTRVKSLL